MWEPCVGCGCRDPTWPPESASPGEDLGKAVLILTGDQVHGQGRDLLRRKLGVFEELKGCSGLSMELEDTV